MTSDFDDIVIEDHRERRQYEVRMGDAVAVLTYRRSAETMTFIHTRIPPPLAGRGLASRIARHALEDARTQGLAVVPICPYMAAFINRHPNYRVLVPDWAQDRYLRDRPAGEREATP